MPDSQLLGILIAAMVAGVLLFRLYTVLGGAVADESLAGITDARIAHATLTGKLAEITVAFRAQFLKGDVQRDVNDVWTFARTLGAAPDWTLVATQGDLP